MGLVEIQVLDCYQNPTYADGGDGSVYGVNPRMANALRPPGEFQVYDIVFRRPLYQGGQVLDPGHVTVFVNSSGCARKRSIRRSNSAMISRETGTSEGCASRSFQSSETKMSFSEAESRWTSGNCSIIMAST